MQYRHGIWNSEHQKYQLTGWQFPGPIVLVTAERSRRICIDIMREAGSSTKHFAYGPYASHHVRLYIHGKGQWCSIGWSMIYDLKSS